MDFSQGGTVRVLRTRVCPGWHGEGQAGDCAVQEGDAAACGENSEARGGVEAVAVLWAAAGYEVCREKGKTFFAYWILYSSTLPCQRLSPRTTDLFCPRLYPVSLLSRLATTLCPASLSSWSPTSRAISTLRAYTASATPPSGLPLQSTTTTRSVIPLAPSVWVRIGFLDS